MEMRRGCWGLRWVEIRDDIVSRRPETFRELMKTEVGMGGCAVGYYPQVSKYHRN